MGQSKETKNNSERYYEYDVSDFNRMGMFNKMISVQRNQQIEHQLRLYSKEHDKLNIITDLTGNTFAIYTSQSHYLQKNMYRR
jgi:hypothetical protein